VQSGLNWKLAMKVSKKPQKFLVAVTLVKITDDPASEQIQRSE
jgi:hypothetical protein